MVLLTPPNVTVSIYAGASAGSPYSFGTLRATVKGVLIPEVQSGRFGSANWLKWTHRLLVPSNTQIQDAYNSQLDPGRNNALGDTVVVTDSGGVNRTAYYVVFVEQISRGTPAQHLRCYLDRFQPNAWPNDAI